MSYHNLGMYNLMSLGIRYDGVNYCNNLGLIHSHYWNVTSIRTGPKYRTSPMLVQDPNYNHASHARERALVPTHDQ